MSSERLGFGDSILSAAAELMSRFCDVEALREPEWRSFVISKASVFSKNFCLRCMRLAFLS